MTRSSEIRCRAHAITAAGYKHETKDGCHQVNACKKLEDAMKRRSFVGGALAGVPSRSH